MWPIEWIHNFEWTPNVCSRGQDRGSFYGKRSKFRSNDGFNSSIFLKNFTINWNGQINTTISSLNLESSFSLKHIFCKDLHFNAGGIFPGSFRGETVRPSIVNIAVTSKRSNPSPSAFGRDDSDKLARLRQLFGSLTL